jgi:hypothetical protein
VKVTGTANLTQIDTDPAFLIGNIYGKPTTLTVKSNLILGTRKALPSYAGLSPTETFTGDISGNTGTYNVR